jgi:hypothetical protein
MYIKDIIQELKKYHIEYDTNIVSIQKIDNKINFEIETNEIEKVEDVRIRKAKKNNE